MTADAETMETSDPDRLVSDPLVTVHMLAYNHAEYLAQAIESVVLQQCDFPFELIIGEDASQDATLTIALAYQRRYPHIIRVIHSRSNVGMNANGGRIFQRARGEFIAFCEGDDYWCSPHKLARQIQSIRADTQVGIVHTDWVKSRYSSGSWRHDIHKSMHARVPLRLLQGDLSATWHFPKILRTCTLLMRRNILAEMGAAGLIRRDYRFGDAVLAAYVTSKWRVAYVPEVMSVYRISTGSALRSGPASRVQFYTSALEFDTDARAYFAGDARYRGDYRWEAAVSLLLWSIRARDVGAAVFALRDLHQHFGVLQFIGAGYRAMTLRWPTLRRQPRCVPVSALPTSS